MLQRDLISSPNRFFAPLSLLLIVDFTGTCSAIAVDADNQCDSMGGQRESNKLHATAFIQVQRSKHFAVSKAASLVDRSKQLIEVALPRVLQRTPAPAPDPSDLEVASACKGAGANLMPGTSDSTTFRCDGGRCIPLTGRCNGVTNCIDNSDELGCPEEHASTVTPSEKPSGSASVSSRGFPKATFAGDLQGAPAPIPDPAYVEAASACGDAGAHLIPGTSDSETFRCEGGRCISLTGRCNGVTNCIDNSDEVGCPEEHASAITPSAPSSGSANVSFLHQVVGTDGVLMLSFARGDFERYRYAEKELRKVGITPTKFIATDGNEASPEVLAKGCFAKQSGRLANKTGTGCVSKVEQAIAESHRQALSAALTRNENWTAIFEDDAVPVLDELGTWDAELKRSWSELPEGVGMIRLGWCQGPGAGGATNYLSTAANGTFMWTRTPRPGGCTTAYLVHKSIIPSLLRIFPCGCAMDCCMEWDYFTKRRRATTTLINLEAQGSVEYIQQHGGADWGVHHGVIMQAKRQLSSTRSK